MRKYFVQLGGVGLDAEVVQSTTPDSKKALGPLSYLITLAQVVARKPPEILIEPLDGPARKGRFVLVGNGRLYGGPFVLFKDARIDDGMLDVLVFENQSHWDILRYVQAIAFGNHSELPDVQYFQTRGLRLSCEEYVPVELDGSCAATCRMNSDFPTANSVFSPRTLGGRRHLKQRFVGPRFWMIPLLVGVNTAVFLFQSLLSERGLLIFEHVFGLSRAGVEAAIGGNTSRMPFSMRTGFTSV